MRKQTSLTLVLVLGLLVPSTSASAETIKASKEQVRSACNKAGGELLGVSDSGSYGCDNGKNGGGMILCNKNSECTAYTASRTSADTKKLKAFLSRGLAAK